MFKQHYLGLTMFALVIVALLITDTVHAASMGGGEGLPWESWLQRIQRSITGPVAFSIMLLSVASAGFMMAFGGQINEFIRVVIYIVLLGAFILGSAQFISIVFSGAVIPRS